MLFFKVKVNIPQSTRTRSYRNSDTSWAEPEGLPACGKKAWQFLVEMNVHLPPSQELLSGCSAGEARTWVHEQLGEDRSWRGSSRRSNLHSRTLLVRGQGQALTNHVDEPQTWSSHT